MPSKYELITELANDTIANITLSTVDWLSFLRLASRMYRYSFSDQVLIYAQRPNATAVAEIQQWNNMRRWVNKGAKGIALITDYRLRHVFDVTDTNSHVGVEPYIWQYKSLYNNDIMQSLGKEYGVEADEDFTQFIRQVAANTDAPNDFCIDSIQFCVMERMGLDGSFLFEDYDLENWDYDLGANIAENTNKILTNIARTVRQCDKIFASMQESSYNEIKGGGNYAKDSLQASERLPITRLETAQTTDIRQVGTVGEKPHEGIPTGDIREVEVAGQAESIPRGSRPTSTATARTPDEPVGGQEPTATAGDDGLGEVAEHSAMSSGRSSDTRPNKHDVDTENETEEINPPFFNVPELPTVAEQLSFILEETENKYTPLYQSYLDFQSQLSGGVFLFYRLGDFYEVFGNEAQLAAGLMGIAVTRRDNGVERIPMCGVPAHLLEQYADKLIEKGYEVAIVEADDNGNRNVRLYDSDIVETVTPEIVTNNYRITDDNLGVGGAKTKYKQNVEAIKLLQTLETDNRAANADEQEVLSQYVGWGGLSQAFKNQSGWENEYAELNSLLTPEEYKAARGSTVNAHYTTPLVIKAMYQALENMGFSQGKILEPACGTGNFLGCIPESLSTSKLYGVELDSLTGRIAKQLYPQANIQIKGYEDTGFPDSFFDVAIGNVPFGSYTINDSRYNKYNFQIHDYFFAKTLDKVRSGGVIAFITSKGTLDKANPTVRKYIAQRAELLGAIRLPNNAFKGNAGTEVTADIIFLQKRERVIDVEPSWVGLGKTEDGIPINDYFIENPQMVLGTMAFDDRMYGRDNETSCIPFEGADLAELLDEAITHIEGSFAKIERDEVDVDNEEEIDADPTLRNYSYALVSGDVYFQIGGSMKRQVLNDTAKERIIGMIGIRDCVRQLIDLQMNNCTDEELSSKQAELNSLYATFTKKYDLLNNRENKRLFADDTSSPLLIALEILDDEGNLKQKSDMFHKRTIKQHVKIEHTDTAVEALGVSLGEKACVDLDFMGELCGLSKDEMLSDLAGVIYRVPNQHESYQTADEYLSGNVRQKLNIAREYAKDNPAYEINVQALERVIPQDIAASDIDVRLGATWLPCEDYKDFVCDLLDVSNYAYESLVIDYNDKLGQWYVGSRGMYKGFKATNTYGTERINAFKIIENTLNLKDVRIFDYVTDDNGKKTPVLNKKDTAIACEKQELIKQAFKDWIWNDPERRERLTRYYNDNFNNTRPREYDGSHLNFIGMNPEVELRKHQIDAVARTIYGGNTLLAHVVGAGKTYEMVASCMESKRLGLCTKSMIVVPNHLTEQWAGDFLQLYPSANILVTRKQDFETDKRKAFCAKIATGDYDAVIIGHSQFGKIPISAERQREQIDDQIFEIEQAIMDIKDANGENWAIKQMETMRKRLEVRLEKLNDLSKKDSVLDFEELGVDRLYIDESDEFKNLFLYTKMRNVAGIGQTDAQKSSDMFSKCRYMDEITDSKGIVFATGTPIANTMSELYTVQRYLQYEELRRRGLLHFDSWASTFGETVTAIELAPEGTGYRSKTRFAKFYNLPELMAMFKEVADIKTADMLDLPTPIANYHNVSVKASDFQKDMVQTLAERADDVRNRRVKPHIDNMLKITNDGRKLALDQRLMNPLLPDFEASKVNACAENVFNIWAEHSENRATQLVFSDLSTPKDDTWNVYSDIRGKLIERGVPQDEIAFIHDANTDVRKKELFAKVRAGSVRIMIGSTSKMGAGTNVQNLLIASHDLDCPWRPRDLEQRAGRIVRQGNTNDGVHIFRYVTENTFDSYLYQILENKQRFISQIMTGKSPVRRVDDIDEATLNYAEIKALATGNPYIKEKMELDIEVGKLKLLKSSHQSQKYNLEDFIMKEYPQEHAYYTQKIEGYKVDIAEYQMRNRDEFVGMTIRGEFYKDKAAAGKQILKAISGMTSHTPTPIGEYMGFELSAEFNLFEKTFTTMLKGATTHKTDLGSDEIGNITRLNNLLAKMSEMLPELEEKLINLEKQYEESKVAVDLPFDREDELEQKAARLAELDALLKVDTKDDQAIMLEDEEETDDCELPKMAEMER